jgi:phosphate transport system ATP-binding protein
MVRETLTLSESAKVNARNLNIWYGDHHAIINADLQIRKNNVTALIGPSGCGKSTFLRALNRMNDFIDVCSTKGSVDIDGIDIYRTQYTNVNNLRKSVGMVFQKPNPFPKSIYDNIAYGPRLHRMYENTKQLNDIVEQSLMKANGQQQRLCIARTLAVDPQILLLDEPCSALDPISTNAIEELILELKKSYTIVMVTHNMQQARRISDTTAYFHMGEIIEKGSTKKIFENPNHRKTKSYVSGDFG